MMKFTTLTESKNTHMEHIEEMIFNAGADGARQAINSLRALRDMLAGTSDTKVNATVKWDGAPAIFAGVDPADGKFFVAKKGVFNKNPKVYKTQADINADLSGDLAKKFTVALEEFSKLGIKSGVYQGDLLFTAGDVKVESVEGEKFYTFQPNTIVYTVPVSTQLGRKISKARVGVVWHTTYTGDSLETMKASFGQTIVNRLTQNPKVFMDDATYRDVTGNATFTKKETEAVTSLLSQAGTVFNRISGKALRTIAGDEELKGKIKQYNNTHVRAGNPFPNPKAHVRGLFNFITDWYDKEIEKKKQPSTKKQWEDKRNAVLRDVFANRNDLVNMFVLMNLIVQAKQMIIDKMNRASHIGTLLRTANGFQATTPEGFVAIDHKGNAVKLVDRLEFSRANFSPDVIKGWQR